MMLVLGLALWGVANVAFVVFMSRRSRVRIDGTGRERASARAALGS